jgi:preprotein translocase subunit SecG
MALVFLILIIVACALLAMMVLIQNPKGGGLAGTFGGFGNQFMGVKQTNDVLEKGTWLFAGILGVLCIVSSLFFTGGTTSAGAKAIQNLNPNSSNTAPALPQPNQNSVPLQQDTNK